MIWIKIVLFTSDFWIISQDVNSYYRELIIKNQKITKNFIVNREVEHSNDGGHVYVRTCGHRSEGQGRVVVAPVFTHVHPRWVIVKW